MQTTLVLAGTSIRQDAAGRFSLNDLHRAAVAAGANARTKEPGKFLAASRTQELVRLLEQESITQNLGNASASETKSVTQNLGDELPGTITPNWRNAPIAKNVGGSAEDTGTYVCLELVVAYGQFVSAAFDLKVIRTFLGTINAQNTQVRKFWDRLRPHWAQIAALALAGFKNVQIAPQVGRSPASVGNCLRRQYEVGYTNPVEVFKARLAPATAARWAIEKPVAAQWGRLQAPATTQGMLDFEGGAA